MQEEHFWARQYISLCDMNIYTLFLGDRIRLVLSSLSLMFDAYEGSYGCCVICTSGILASSLLINMFIKV